VKKLKLLAYPLEDLRIPQVGNPWLKATTQTKYFTAG